MIIYCSYIVGGVILYVFCGMPLFDAINHSIGAVSTGGFSTKVESIGYYDSASIELVTIILMLLETNFWLSTVTYFNCNSFGFFMLIFTMIIGGGTGSKTGGLKLYRVLILLKMVY